MAEAEAAARQFDRHRNSGNYFQTRSGTAPHGFVVAIHHTQINRPHPLEIGAESEASHEARKKDAAALQRPAGLKSVPASTAVPAAAAKQQNDKDNDENRRGIHVRLPRNAAYCAAEILAV
jgi:hypothetical protein